MYISLGNLDIIKTWYFAAIHNNEMPSPFAMPSSSESASTETRNICESSKGEEGGGSITLSFEPNWSLQADQICTFKVRTKIHKYIIEGTLASWPLIFLFTADS